MKNGVQLISYPDSLGGDIRTLEKILGKYFEGCFRAGVHILPPYPSSGDRGFAPLTCLHIDPRFGSWADINRLSQKYDIILDLMVNHISAKSAYFIDYLAKGDASEFKNLFLPVEAIWPGGKIPGQDMKNIFLRRNEPYSEFMIGPEKRRVKIWTTFGKTTPSEQIDLNISSETTRSLFIRFLDNFACFNVKMVRLDAVGYTVKKPGTSFFMVEPEVYEFLDWFSQCAAERGITLLPEVHADFATQSRLAASGFRIYDFILPFMILEALILSSSTRLKEYLAVRPHNQFTMLDCHDGIPVKPDLDGMVDSSAARKIVDLCLQRGANLSKLFSARYFAGDGFDIHQIRCSYYSMLDCDDDAYLAARAIQFFTPGIPQVYYVGLLAGKNDEENVLRQGGDGREINRHNFTQNEISEAVRQPVVQRLVSLIHFRNSHPSFHGEFILNETGTDSLSMTWKKGDDNCTLDVNLVTKESRISVNDEKGNIIKHLV